MGSGRSQPCPYSGNDGVVLIGTQTCRGRGPEAFTVPDTTCTHMCQLPENPLLAVGLHGCFEGVVPKLGDAELGDISES